VTIDGPPRSPTPSDALTAARLRESERRFRLAMAHAPIGMALVGLDGRFLEANQRLCEIVGRPEEVLRELTFQDITHPDDLDADLTSMHQLLAGEISWYSMEKRYLHADGHQVWILLSGSIVRDDDGAPVHFIAQIQDISPRKAQEAELRRVNAELGRSNDELQRFAAVVSHDLRSPLATVQGLLSLLLELHGHELGDEARDLTSRAMRQTERLTGTVSALLELASVKTAPSVITPVGLREVVAAAAEDLAPQLAEGGATLRVDDLPVVHGDEHQLRVLFQNLLSNAVRYRDRARPPTITVRADRVDDVWCVVVEDDGRGFDPADRETIFEPFARGPRDEADGGTGLGLATCRRIVERLGGTIDAEPLDPGARFTVRLPATEPAAARPVSGSRAG
jgi:PAS domain S-box-containing protein